MSGKMGLVGREKQSLYTPTTGNDGHDYQPYDMHGQQTEKDLTWIEAKKAKLLRQQSAAMQVQPQQFLVDFMHKQRLGKQVYQSQQRDSMQDLKDLNDAAQKIGAYYETSKRQKTDLNTLMKAVEELNLEAFRQLQKDVSHNYSSVQAKVQEMGQKFNPTRTDHQREVTRLQTEMQKSQSLNSQDNRVNREAFIYSATIDALKQQISQIIGLVNTRPQSVLKNDLIQNFVDTTNELRRGLFEGINIDIQSDNILHELGRHVSYAAALDRRGQLKLSTVKVQNFTRAYNQVQNQKAALSRGLQQLTAKQTQQSREIVTQLAQAKEEFTQFQQFANNNNNINTTQQYEQKQQSFMQNNDVSMQIQPASSSSFGQINERSEESEDDDDIEMEGTSQQQSSQQQSSFRDSMINFNQTVNNQILFGVNRLSRPVTQTGWDKKYKDDFDLYVGRSQQPLIQNNSNNNSSSNGLSRDSSSIVLSQLSLPSGHSVYNNFTSVNKPSSMDNQIQSAFVNQPFFPNNASSGAAIKSDYGQVLAGMFDQMQQTTDPKEAYTLLEEVQSQILARIALDQAKNSATSGIAQQQKIVSDYRTISQNVHLDQEQHLLSERGRQLSPAFKLFSQLQLLSDDVIQRGQAMQRMNKSTMKTYQDAADFFGGKFSRSTVDTDQIAKEFFNAQKAHITRMLFNSDWQTMWQTAN